jgi:hypothetical protein
MFSRCRSAREAISHGFSTFEYFDLTTIPLNLYRFEGGKTLELRRFDKPFSGQFSVSPHEKWLAYSQHDSSVYDLILVENFR